MRDAETGQGGAGAAADGATARFPIAFDAAYALLSRALLLAPEASYVELSAERVSVRMGWAFRATFDRARIAAAAPLSKRARLTRGVHGWAGRWLVNGSGDGLLSIEIDPPQKAWVLGAPVRLRELVVSVEDPVALASALRGQAGS